MSQQDAERRRRQQQEWEEDEARRKQEKADADAEEARRRAEWEEAHRGDPILDSILGRNEEEMRKKGYSPQDVLDAMADLKRATDPSTGKVNRDELGPHTRDAYTDAISADGTLDPARILPSDIVHSERQRDEGSPAERAEELEDKFGKSLEEDRKIAGDPDTPQIVLEEIIDRSTDWETFGHVLLNPNTTPEICAKIAENEFIRDKIMEYGTDNMKEVLEKYIPKEEKEDKKESKE